MAGSLEKSTGCPGVLRPAIDVSFWAGNEQFLGGALILLKTKKTFDAQSALAFSIKSDYSISMDAALAMEMKSLSLDIKNSVSTAITAGASMNYKAGGVIALAAPAVQLGA